MKLSGLFQSSKPLVTALYILLVTIGPTSAGDVDPSPSTTIIDILSASPEYSILLHYLQKHGLVNLINQSRNSTLLAPVNSAFYQLEEDGATVTKDLLLYHFLNGTVVSDNVTSDVVLQSHLSKRLYEAWDDDEDEHDREGEEELKDGIPVVISPDSSHDSDDDGIGLKVNGQATVVELDQMAGYHRGVVQGVDSLLSIPPTLCEVIEAKSRKHSFFSELFSLEYNCDSSRKKQTKLRKNLVTLLVPNDNAFDKFIDVEKDYLLSASAKADREILINRHTIDHLLKPQAIQTSIEPRHRSERSSGEMTAVTADGTVLKFDRDYIINSTFNPDEVNILTRDGIIYTYDSLLSTRQDASSKVVEFNPEKYLHGLGADLFVEETYLRGLQSLIDGTETEPQSIFVYPIGTSETNSHPNIKYHIVKGANALEDLDTRGTYLLTSKLSSHRMGDYYQKIKAIVSSEGTISLNSQLVLTSDYNVGNTSIYLLEGDLDVPPSLAFALGPFFQSSFSVAFLESTGLISPPKNDPPRTYLVPSRRAWENQILLKLYLQSNHTALRAVFESLIFETPVYSNEKPRVVESLDGTKSKLSVFSGGEGRHNGPYIARVNNTSYDIDAEDILFNSGVAHSIDQLSIPKHVEVSPHDLIIAGDRKDFVDLLKARNMSHILDRNESYTILVPNMDQLADNGYYANSSKTDRLLSLHILPDNPINTLFAGEAIPTLDEDVQLSGRNVTENFHILSIVDGTGQETYVVSRGDAQNHEFGKHSTVLFLDRYISPDWVHTPLIRPPYRLKTHVAILIGAALGLILAATSIVTCLYAFVGTRKATDPENDEHRPLLRDRTTSPSGRSTRSARSNRSRRDSNNGASDVDGTSPNSTSNNFYSTISSNSSINPIATGHVNEHREFGRHLNLPSP
ncbi:hypothetical protein AWJ20_225 [Sugiyamaella lignohabitans]|uniref:FAS1 domain-containing protein n=1 Tax=Sugiyamaella lignohabitans TaxID=796027 RepID=A0A161HI18_9ASCO|nr:uncharacterized protein AWJ20_225 [Sugiyamaella lignohabitans]ANB11997.1 hypothetical protein AWJ20_225 [Sugiyamaella lignohabitans]